MKKFIPYLLFSATTLHTFLAVSPVMAMACETHSDKASIDCEDNDIYCKKKFSTQKNTN